MPGRDVDPTVCPACGSALAAWRLVPASEHLRAGEQFELWRCSGCGSAVTAGRPEPELHESGAYRPGRPRLHGLAQPWLRAFDGRRLALLGELAEPGSRVLDAGAGQGRFVARARESGYDASGIEPAERGVQRAAALGAQVLRTSIERADVAPLYRLLSQTGFEVVRVVHVLLEHNPFGMWQSVLNRVTEQPSYAYTCSNAMRRCAPGI